MNPASIIQNLQMYFSPDTATKMAELEKNPKYYTVSAILDAVITQATKDLTDPLYTPGREHRPFKAAW